MIAKTPRKPPTNPHAPAMPNARACALALAPVFDAMVRGVAVTDITARAVAAADAALAVAVRRRSRLTAAEDHLSSVCARVAAGGAWPDDIATVLAMPGTKLQVVATGANYTALVRFRADRSATVFGTHRSAAPGTISSCHGAVEASP